MTPANILVLVDLILAVSQRASALSAIYRKMREEGRTTLNPEEWAAVREADDSADARLEADIARAKAEGR